MGGRGASSKSGKHGLPNGARAFTITGQNGTEQTYFEQDGMLMRSEVVGVTNGKSEHIPTDRTIGDLYQRAVDRGDNVRLISKSEAKSNNAAYKQHRAGMEEALTIADNQPGSKAVRRSRNNSRTYNRTRGR